MRTAKRKCANDDPSAPKGSFFNCMKRVKEIPKYLTSCSSEEVTSSPSTGGSSTTSGLTTTGSSGSFGETGGSTGGSSTMMGSTITGVSTGGSSTTMGQTTTGGSSTTMGPTSTGGTTMSVAALTTLVNELTNTVNNLNAAIAALNAIITRAGRFRHIRAVATTCTAFIDLVKSCKFHISDFYTSILIFFLVNKAVAANPQDSDIDDIAQDIVSSNDINDCNSDLLDNLKEQKEKLNENVEAVKKQISDAQKQIEAATGSTVVPVTDSPPTAGVSPTSMTTGKVSIPVAGEDSALDFLQHMHQHQIRTMTKKLSLAFH